MGLGSRAELGPLMLASLEVLGLYAASSFHFAASSSLLVFGELVPLLLLLLLLLVSLIGLWKRVWGISVLFSPAAWSP